MQNVLDRIAYAVLYAFVFVIPWGESFAMLGGFVLVRWIGFLAFGVAALRTIVNWRGRKPSPLHYSMLALIGWSAISILWTVDWDSTVARVGTYLQMVILIWLIWELATTETRVIRLLESYVFGTIISSVSIIYNFVTGRTSAQLTATYGIHAWETFRYSVSGVNAVDVGLMLALGIPMIFYLLLLRRGPMALLYWVQLVLCVTSIMLTGARGALLAAVVAFAMMPLILRRLPRSQRFVPAVAVMSILACGVYLVPEGIQSRILSLGSEISGGTLTHRTVIWAAGWEAFRDHALLGVGSGAYGPTILKVVDIPYVAHNTFLSVLVELGVVGALLLLVLLAGWYFCAVRMRYIERCLWLTLLMTWAIGVSSLTWEYRKPTWLLFGLLAAHAYSRRLETTTLARPRRYPMNAA